MLKKKSKEIKEEETKKRPEKGVGLSSALREIMIQINREDITKKALRERFYRVIQSKRRQQKVARAQKLRFLKNPKIVSKTKQEN